MSAQAIAIVGLACRYPDAPDPQSLWGLVLSGRRAFRPIPPSRLRLGDDHRTGRDAPAAAGVVRAALIEDWKFDRAEFQISDAAYHAADPAHWLALETAARALADAGFPGGNGLGRDRAGVILGHSLTGEAIAAATLRRHWPYVRKVLAGALEVPTDEDGHADFPVTASTALERAGRNGTGPWSGDPTGSLVESQRGECGSEQAIAGPLPHSAHRWRHDVLEAAAKAFLAPWPEVTTEMLAGGLSPAIADRICGYFGFRGGGHTVDGACSSSLLAVASACRALTTGELDFVLAGGAEIGLDPF